MKIANGTILLTVMKNTEIVSETDTFGRAKGAQGKPCIPPVVYLYFVFIYEVPGNIECFVDSQILWGNEASV